LQDRAKPEHIVRVVEVIDAEEPEEGLRIVELTLSSKVPSASVNVNTSPPAG